VNPAVSRFSKHKDRDVGGALVLPLLPVPHRLSDPLGPLTVAYPTHQSTGLQAIQAGRRRRQEETVCQHPLTV
jgi:hypothetical protein